MLFTKTVQPIIRQYDFRTNIDGKISKNIDIAFDVAGREELRNYPTRSVGA